MPGAIRGTGHGKSSRGVLVTPGAGPGEVPGHAAAVWPAVTAAAGQMVIGMDREGKLSVRAAGGIRGRWCVLAWVSERAQP